MARFMALYMGSTDSDAQKRWEAFSQAEQADHTKRAMAAWGDWVEQHKSAIRDMGSPLGKTLLTDPNGISQTKNAIAAYVTVEAPSHRAAAEMFSDHPHFSIFPGTGVEILECLPMPGA